MTKWRNVIPTVMEGGDVGGDFQAGESYMRRAVFGPVDGRYMVADDYIYPELVRSYFSNLDWVDDMVLVTMTTFTICTDPDDPGSTELDRTHEYGDPISHRVYFDVAEAERAARRVAERGSWADNLEHYDPTDELAAGLIRNR